jgi:hypothetical protein
MAAIAPPRVRAKRPRTVDIRLAFAAAALICRTFRPSSG